MKTKFNEYLNEDRNLDAKIWLLKQPFIIEDQQTKELKVVGVGYKNFPECINNKFKWNYVPLTYSSLVRLMLFYWLSKYNGKEELFIDIKNEVTKPNKADFFRPFSQIPTNFIVLSNYFKSIIGKGATIETTDTLILATLLAKKDILFTEENIKEWYNTVQGLTKRSDEGEEKTIQFILDKGIFTKAEKGTPIEDKLDIDIIAYKGDVEVPIQVKEPSKDVDIVMYRSKNEFNGKYPYIIMIKNTNLEFHQYLKKTDGSLPWKFLFLWDYKQSKLYCINSYSITSINKAANNNVFINMDLTDEWIPKMIKTYDI